MIRKLTSGEYRIYSRKKSPKTNRRKNLGTFKTLAAAKKHERAIQYFKRQGWHKGEGVIDENFSALFYEIGRGAAS